MKIDQLRDTLRQDRMNLSALARLTGIPLRTLRRLKNGDGDAMAATVERIEPCLRKAMQQPKTRSAA